MSSIDSIGLHLGSAHLRKMGNGHNIQLSHDQLHSALNGEPTAEFDMAKKHITEMLRAHRQGKGYRIMHKKIHGGKITLKSIGRKISHVAKKIIHNPTVKKVAKELGHIAVGVANNYAAENGVNTGAYAHLAHKAIESKNIRKELEDQIGNDIMDYAHEQAGPYGGKIRIPKGLKDFWTWFCQRSKNRCKQSHSPRCGNQFDYGCIDGSGSKT